MTPDSINGLFELFGGIFISISIYKLYKEKIVRGVSWIHVGFFSAWGIWNLYYYPTLGQWMSFYGGIGVTSTNSIFLGQLIYYTLKERTGDE